MINRLFYDKTSHEAGGGKRYVQGRIRPKKPKNRTPVYCADV
nr:MAG TPA: hypothetical protein [Caudoviricetes sp.]DAW17600.1 MAG TPA: hypothetical protein [Caudoviricetes sp.]